MREVIQVNTSGQSFVIFQEEVISVKESQILHKLPLTGKGIAGISYINDRVLTFLDFAECIGIKPSVEKRESHVLLLSEYDIAGFAVSGDIHNYSISDKDISHVHTFIRNDIIDRIIIRNQIPIPIINIMNLYNYIKRNYTAFKYTPVMEYTSNTEINGSENFYIVNSGHETFAVPLQNSQNNPEKTENIIPLSILPGFIKGIFLHKNNLIPLIDLSIRMRLNNNNASDLMLLTDINGVIGLAFNSLKFNHQVNCDQVLLLPPLVQTKWMRSGIKYNNDIFPVVEPARLLASALDGSDEIRLNERYKPDSLFLRKIQKETIRVIEIRFSGAIHAVPEMEVEDIIKIKAYFKVPNCKSIIAGITEHKGELLPVIDPAVCYGLKSSPDENWKMILIKNGNFRGFLITEKVYDTKDIRLKDQRELPIKLDFQLVYLCYPDIENKKVRFVINIEALAVYFEESMIREISDIFVNQIHEDISEITIIETDDKLINGDIEINELTSQDEYAEVFKEKEKAIGRNVPAEEIIQDKTLDIEENDNYNELPEEIKIEPENAEKEEVKVNEDHRELFSIEEEQIPEPAESEVVIHDDSQNQPEPDEEYSQVILSAEQEEQIVNADTMEPVEHEKEKEEFVDIAPSYLNKSNETSSVTQINFSDAGVQIRRFKFNKKYKLIIDLIFILIAAIVLFILINNSNNRLQVVSPKNTETENIISTEHNIKESLQKGQSANKENISSEYIYKIYNVEKGDTLYEITESFTGNGFDYPEVARENDIKNPDLIFPEQDIKIKVKKNENR